MKGSVSALSAGAYTATFFVMEDIVKGGWACTPHTFTSLGSFSIMIECTPESIRRHLCVLSLLCGLPHTPIKRQTEVLNQNTTDITEIFKEQILNGVVHLF
jgi:hypothetical protein